MNRFELMSLLQRTLQENLVICNIGLPSQELYKINDCPNYFYMLGSMGLASSIGLGLALSQKKNVITIDGDGSILMHLGSLKTAGTFASSNFKYILLNNNSHDSVGGQNTYADSVDFKKLSRSLGFKKFYCIKNNKNLKKNIKSFLSGKSLNFMEVKTSNSKIKKLPRPKNLIKIKNQFMK